jgi:hypothetical protein
MPLNPRLVICYLSELNFYAHTGDGRLLPFLSWQGISDLRRLDPNGVVLSDRMGLGIFGMLLPAFRQRRAIELALLGGEAGDAGAMQSADGSKTAKSLEQIAATRGAEYLIGPESEFLKSAFRMFLERNRAAGITTILIRGQVNPVLEEHIPASVREEFPRFLHALKDDREPRVVVLDDCPRHTAEAYGNHDLMHIRKSERERFTQALASRLAPILDEVDDHVSTGEIASRQLRY